MPKAPGGSVFVGVVGGGALLEIRHGEGMGTPVRGGVGTSGEDHLWAKILGHSETKMRSL